MGVGAGHVLVIGDAPAVVDLLRAQLRAEGVEVTGASDEIEGIRRASGDDVTLVVLDRIVSGRDGLAILMLVSQRRPALPIIVLSARAGVADRIAAFDAGAKTQSARASADKAMSGRFMKWAALLLALPLVFRTGAVILRALGALFRLVFEGLATLRGPRLAAGAALFALAVLLMTVFRRRRR